MMGELKKSTNKEKALVQEINSFLNQLYSAPLNEQRIILNTIISLTNQLKIINNSIPAFVHNLGQGVNVEKQRPVSVKLNGKRKKLVHINGELVKKRVGKAEKRLKKRPEEKQKEVGGVLGNRIMILAADKKRFLKELNIAESEIKRLKKMKKKKKPKDENIFKKPRIYAKLSNRFFFKISNKLVDEGNFERVGLSMKKANMTFLLNTYVAMMLFSVLISMFVALLLFVLFLFLKLSPGFPFLDFVDFTKESVGLRVLKNFWLLIAFPLLTFILFYFYPSLEASATAKKINQELPFVTIHMSAIAGSGIEPTQIFRIIASGKEYPKVKVEIGKLLNRVNVYGHDLVSALRASAETTSSKNLSELFSGLSTTITTGSSLPQFLDERAETLLFDYKSEKEKYIRAAEIFMDIYLGVAVAAPMLLTLLLVIMGIGGISTGMSVGTMTTMIIAIIAALNILFIAFLHMRQPQF